MYGGDEILSGWIDVDEDDYAYIAEPVKVYCAKYLIFWMSGHGTANSTNAIITYGEDVGDGSDEWGKYVCCSM